MFVFNFFASEVARSLSGKQKYSVLEDYVRRNEKRGLYELSVCGLFINLLYSVVYVLIVLHCYACLPGP